MKSFWNHSSWPITAAGSQMLTIPRIVTAITAGILQTAITADLTPNCLTLNSIKEATVVNA